MKGSIIQFDNSTERYRKVAGKFAEKEQFDKTLALLLSAKDKETNLGVICDIADTYADMGMLEESNHYWFKYLDRAPADKLSVAYEELAINYFYLDDFWASSYYFHKKIDVDGYISKDGIDPEILDFFSGEEHKKALYHVAWPPQRADYSGKIKMAKHAIVAGDFNGGSKILSSIPQECLDEDTCGDLAICYYMSDRLDEGAAACRNSLANHGDNVTAFCNLSTVYAMKEDDEKSEYYYKKALECRKGERTEAYKIATCAIEREDHVVAKECLEKIVQERPYDTAMLFFNSIASVNLGDYQKAYDLMLGVLRLTPEDKIVKYYISLINSLIKDGVDKDKLLPLKYVKELPEKIEKKRIRKIKELVKEPSKISLALKKAEIKEIIEWGLSSKKSETLRESAYVLSMAYNQYAKKIMLNALLDSDAPAELKRVLVYAMAVNGYKEKFGVVAGKIFLKVKPKKLSFEKNEDAGAYVRAYSLALSRAIFWDIDKLDKLAIGAEKVYKKLNGVVTESDITGDELSALMVYASKFERFEKFELIANLFEIKKERFDQIKKLIEKE